MIKYLIHFSFLFFLIQSNLFSQSIDGQKPNCKIDEQIEIFKLAGQVEKSLSKTSRKNGYYQTSYNLKIEESCKERMPIDVLEKFYRTTMSEGVLCLSKLSNIGLEGSKNIKCFQNLFKNKDNPPKLLCGSWPFGKEITAVGSFPGNSKRHPYLWISPETTGALKSNPLELKATIFHEMLHNCGYTHSEGVEITYACEECCFVSGLSEKKKNAACNICGGKYADENLPEYVKDLLVMTYDYKNLGRDMRIRLLDIAITNKNRESLFLIFNESKMNDFEKESLINLLMENKSEEQVNKVKKIIQSHQTLSEYDRPLVLLNSLLKK